MFETLIKKLGFDKNERHLKRYRKIVEAINRLEPEMEKLSDQELSALGNKFKERALVGESLDSMLPEVFAAVREASKGSLA